jgi:hypothetical protein
MQRLSIYADDVVVFVRPVVPELVAIRDILTVFGEASGLKVNYSKSSATVIRGGELERVRTQSILGCPLLNFPIKYLGLQLALRPLTRAQWQPALDKIIDFMPSWQRGLIAKQGRLILIKTVIAAKPIHQVLVEDAPVWMLEAIEKWQRSFFWAGKETANGGQCLVAWDSVCRPYEFGGLGVKNLRLQGVALRVRWEWLRRTDLGRPWQGLPAIKDDMASEVFVSLVKITVGRGNRVFFWTDRWINGVSVLDIAPEVLGAINTRRKKKRTVQEGLTNNKWTQDIAAELSPAGLYQFVQLSLAILNLDRIEEEEEDRFSWPCDPSGLYSAKSTYSRLCEGKVRFASSDGIWKPWAPLKCKIFQWLFCSKQDLDYRSSRSPWSPSHGG